MISRNTFVSLVSSTGNVDGESSAQLAGKERSVGAIADALIEGPTSAAQKAESISAGKRCPVAGSQSIMSKVWENHFGITRMSVLPLSWKGFYAKRKLDS